MANVSHFVHFPAGCGQGQYLLLQTRHDLITLLQRHLALLETQGRLLIRGAAFKPADLQEDVNGLRREVNKHRA